MYLKNDRIIVRVAGLTFKSHGSPGESHFRLDPTAIVGWFDGADTRRDTSTRPIGWGDFAEIGRQSSRLITITGTAIAANEIELRMMRDAFVGMCADGGYRELSLETKVDTRYANVTRASKPLWTPLIDTAAAWSFDFYAPDPRIYGTIERLKVGDSKSSTGGFDYPVDYMIDYHSDTEIGGVVSVTNNGNVEAWPVFIINGEYNSGFSISNNRGSEVRWEGFVTNASPVTVDMISGTVTQSGRDRSELLSKRGWFSVQPGETLQPAFTPIQPGPGWCDIIFRDTWI
jgi:hypothetical protein